jgi:methyltransferase (TIGR00027 family)
LRDNGFDAMKPSAWIAEGLLIYLPATAQHQLFAGIDALAAPGSHVAVEEGAPMRAEEFQAALDDERSAEDGRGPFFQLVYNEQHAPAAQWFGERGWTAVTTPLPRYLRSLGRPVPSPDTEAGGMLFRVNLVSARRG